MLVDFIERKPSAPGESFAVEGDVDITVHRYSACIGSVCDPVYDIISSFVYTYPHTIRTPGTYQVYLRDGIERTSNTLDVELACPAGTTWNGNYCN